MTRRGERGSQRGNEGRVYKKGSRVMTRNKPAA